MLLQRAIQFDSFIALFAFWRHVEAWSSAGRWCGEGRGRSPGRRGGGDLAGGGRCARLQGAPSRINLVCRSSDTSRGCARRWDAVCVEASTSPWIPETWLTHFGLVLLANAVVHTPTNAPALADSVQATFGWRASKTLGVPDAYTTANRTAPGMTRRRSRKAHVQILVESIVAFFAVWWDVKFWGSTGRRRCKGRGRSAG